MSSCAARRLPPSILPATRSPADGIEKMPGCWGVVAGPGDQLYVVSEDGVYGTYASRFGRLQRLDVG